MQLGQTIHANLILIELACLAECGVRENRANEGGKQSGPGCSRALLIFDCRTRAFRRALIICPVQNLLPR